MTLQEAIEVLRKRLDTAIDEFHNAPDGDCTQYALARNKWATVCYTLDDAIDILDMVDE